MEKQELDFVLVPLGLIVMAGYHAWLFHRVIRHPTRTVIGINSINRRLWVESMMQDQTKNGVLAVQTLRNNIMASTLLASTAIMLSSLIAVLMTSGGGGVGRARAGRVRAGRREPARALDQVLLHSRLLSPRVPLERAVHTVLQPREHPHQRAGEDAQGVGGVRERRAEPGQLLLVAGASSVLLLVPSRAVDLRADPNGGLVLGSRRVALLLGCVFWLGRSRG
ncbi:hypothetical protein J5N97_025519 [Dioscorea zingiberensis]|uniref:Uncharacterized protein n=1 Tax=Dioscorea zingiberensis TaxID=325984 RepID=A0A9D5C8E4_9LILI|nr:hypothetical protein J5N97_025519 [Dioscorea zingiberensis]